MLLASGHRSIARKRGSFLRAHVPHRRVVRNFSASYLRIYTVKLFFRRVTVPRNVINGSVSATKGTNRRRFVVVSMFTLISIGRNGIRDRIRLQCRLRNVTGMRPSFVHMVKVLRPQANRILLLIISFGHVRRPTLQRSFYCTGYKVPTVDPCLRRLPKAGRPSGRLRRAPLRVSKDRTKV